MITGLSGSGKSSLAFDTLYAEGQRRYVESLSAYARQFLQLMEKPDVDLIEGLSPAIAIEQKSTSHNPRSTVGTVTEIYDYLRLLYARIGTPYCPDHPEQALESQTVSQMVDTVLALPPDTRLMILAPVVTGRKGEHLDLFESLQAQGFVRVRVRTEGKAGGDAGGAVATGGPGGLGGQGGQVYELDSAPALNKLQKHSIDVVVDRIKVGPRSSSALPSRSKPRCGWPTGVSSRNRSTAARSRSSPASSPARSATGRCANSSRACSPSTTRSGPARNATASAWCSSSTRRASCSFPT